MARRSDFEHHWFSQDPVPSWPPPSVRPPPPPIGAGSWALGLGALSGCIGGFLWIVVAQCVLDYRHARLDVVRGFGALAARAVATPLNPQLGGLVGAALIGAVLGAPLGYLSRRLLRIVPRLLFFSLLLSAAWILVQGLVLRRLGGSLGGQIPFGPLLVGCLAYSACLAGVVPLRARAVPGR